MSRPRKNPRPGTPAWRAMHRERMQLIRARKRRDRECRRCPDRVAFSQKTGEPLDQCRKHADEDNERNKAKARKLRG